MAKNAEDRYQSTYGLKADLEKCLQQWQTVGRVDFFLLGQQDVTDRFHIPQKLYGREAEVGDLLAALSASVRAPVKSSSFQGMPALASPLWCGKSIGPITQKRGYFAAGKFDQFHRDIPYASLTQAFQSLIRQLLTESEDQIGTWHKKLLAARPNGQVITDVIPDWNYSLVHNRSPLSTPRRDPKSLSFDLPKLCPCVYRTPPSVSALPG